MTDEEQPDQNPSDTSEAQADERESEPKSSLPRRAWRYTWRSFVVLIVLAIVSLVVLDLWRVNSLRATMEATAEYGEQIAKEHPELADWRTWYEENVPRSDASAKLWRGLFGIHNASINLDDPNSIRNAHVSGSFEYRGWENGATNLAESGNRLAKLYLWLRNSHKDPAPERPEIAEIRAEDAEAWVVFSQPLADLCTDFPEDEVFQYHQNSVRNRNFYSPLAALRGYLLDFSDSLLLNSEFDGDVLAIRAAALVSLKRDDEAIASYQRYFEVFDTRKSSFLFDARVNAVVRFSLAMSLRSVANYVLIPDDFLRAVFDNSKWTLSQGRILRGELARALAAALAMGEKGDPALIDDFNDEEFVEKTSQQDWLENNPWELSLLRIGYVETYTSTSWVSGLFGLEELKQEDLGRYIFGEQFPLAIQLRLKFWDSATRNGKVLLEQDTPRNIEPRGGTFASTIGSTFGMSIGENIDYGSGMWDRENLNALKQTRAKQELASCAVELEVALRNDGLEAMKEALAALLLAHPEFESRTFGDGSVALGIKPEHHPVDLDEARGLADVDDEDHFPFAPFATWIGPQPE